MRGKAPEQLVDRHHANLHDRALQIVQHPRLEGHGIGKLAAQRLFRKALGKFAERLLQHRLADNQLAHQVEHVVDAAGIHAQNVFLQGRRSGRFVGQRIAGGAVG